MGVKKIWGDPVWSKVISNTIWFIMAAAGAHAVAHWWKPVSTALIHFWDYLAADAAVPRWLFWLLVLGVVGTVVRAGAIAFSRSSAEAWRSYTEDEFHSIRWHWKLSDSGRPYDLYALCRKCSFQLDIARDENMFTPCTTYTCPCGGTSVPFNDRLMSVENRILKLIQQRLRTGERQQARREG